MVIRNLQSYVEAEVPEAFYYSNLKYLIEKNKSDKDRPIIVIDSSTIYYNFDNLNELQPCNCSKTLEDFMNKIISFGANLVVFIRKSSWEMLQWYAKRQFYFTGNKYWKNEVINENLIKFIKITLKCFCFFEKLSSNSNNHFEVVTEIKMIHKEVAEMATKHNCLAVIGLDSNYYTYEGIKCYIHTSKFDYDTFYCEIFDKKKLLKHLDLHSYHLPLFATLCGNDIVSSLHLQPFHKKLKKIFSSSDKFLCIAKIVRDTTCDPYKHAKEMADLINHPEITENTIKKKS